MYLRWVPINIPLSHLYSVFTLPLKLNFFFVTNDFSVNINKLYFFPLFEQNKLHLIINLILFSIMATFLPPPPQWRNEDNEDFFSGIVT